LRPLPAFIYPVDMKRCTGKLIDHLCRPMRPVLAVVFGMALLLPAYAQHTGESAVPAGPLPQDTGAAGLKEALRRLQTTARLLQIDAHPDDEDGGMLTLESRGKGAAVTLLTLTRGEGGQNKTGSNLFDVLGVLRTLEVLAADRYYGIEQRFTRVADFGYSKNPEETFQKWQGHDVALGDIVRVIRTFHPDVLVARFSGTERDGHGHHQASAILTKEAFRAAADPKRFPEQIQEGLLPWQAKKLYIGNVCQFFAQTCPDKDYTVKLNTGEVDPVLATSYIQLAIEGLRHQQSQGLGGISLPSGPRYTFYRLVDSVVLSKLDKDGHEKDFFDGIDTSLPGLAARWGDEAKQLPDLRSELGEIEKDVEQARANSENAAEPLLWALQLVERASGEVKRSKVDEAAKQDLLLALTTKQKQFEHAVNLALGVEFRVTTEAPAGTNAEDVFTAIPGRSFRVKAIFASHRQGIEDVKVELDLPAGWKSRLVDSATAPAGAPRTFTFEVGVPPNAQYTRPYWHRANPETDSVNTIDRPQYATLPFPPAPVQAHAAYMFDGKSCAVHATGMTEYKDEAGKETERAIAVTPAFSVMLEPGEQIVPVASRSAREVKVQVRSEVNGQSEGQLSLQAPREWRVEPPNLPVGLPERGQTKDFEFKVLAANLNEGRTEIRAVLEAGGKKYSEGYTLVTREDLGAAYYYQPAVQRVSIVEVKIPHGLKVGYIMGAGDDIPTVLDQIGMDVTLIAPEKLASEDLRRYGTIVLGIRAYDTVKDVATNNRKLLDFVSAGGTLVAQYNTGVSDFNSGHFTPYPAELSRARVSVEEAPVQILDPQDSVFHSPNEITQRDFDGWVQERGLYFMDQWDSHFKPLLGCKDPGEPLQEGGLLRAQYGKGTYIYTGYAFFRQLPAGVPGAIRLYVNLLNAGH